MRIYTHNNALRIARALPDKEFRGCITFHSYWSGELNEKHAASIQSCWKWNVQGRANRKIVLWVNKHVKNDWSTKVSEWCVIREFDLEEQKRGTPVEGQELTFNPALSFYSDVVRYLLLCRYGGVWFDLDVFWLRCLDPVLSAFSHDVCVYQWERQPYPNGAVFVCLQSHHPELLKAIKLLHDTKRGWGFQEAGFGYDSSVDFLVLPCSWFDAGWVDGESFQWFFLGTTKTIDTFYPGAFAFHWHNKWHDTVHSDSMFSKLAAHINK
jgi:hypothetical protein